MNQDKQSFSKRVNRIDPDFKPSYFRRWRNRPRRQIVIPMARSFLALCLAYGALTGFKVTMENEFGRDGYDAKLAALSQGGDAERIAGKLLARDRIMVYVQKNI